MRVTRRGVLAGVGAVAAAPARAAAAGRLVFLSANAVWSAGLDGSDLKKLHEAPRRSGVNDGVAVDPASGRIFWTNMGRPSADDGTIWSCAPDGGDARLVVPPGATHTPKQLKIAAGRLWWADREGMAVMRAGLDGAGVETLVATGAGDEDRKDPRRWCVGVAVDAARNTLWWTQKGGDDAGEGSLRRARLDRLAEVEVVLAGLPEPIDLDIDHRARRLYWTDRGDNTVSRMALDGGKREVLVRGLSEAIGVALDPAGGRMFFSALGGELGTARLDGSGARTLFSGLGMLTGVAVA